MFTHGSKKGLSISSEAMRLWLHGILDGEEGLGTGAGAICVVGESRKLTGGVVLVSGGGGLVLGGGSGESGDVSVGEPRFSTCKATS